MPCSLELPFCKCCKLLFFISLFKGNANAFINPIKPLSSNVFHIFPSITNAKKCDVINDLGIDKKTCYKWWKVIKEELSHLVIVSNNIFEDGKCYDSVTMAYIRAMGRINEQLARLSDEVVEVVVGIPVMVKK